MKALLLVLAVLVSGQALGRDQKAVRAFKSANVCPSTGLMDAYAPCPGYVVDHAIPLCANGRDHPSNMVYQEVTASYRKDVDERALCKRIAEREALIKLLRSKLDGQT